MPGQQKMRIWQSVHLWCISEKKFKSQPLNGGLTSLIWKNCVHLAQNCNSPEDMKYYVRCFRFTRSFRHFCSARSTSSFGTAMTRFVRFVNRSIGVLPGMLTFIGNHHVKDVCYCFVPS